MPVLVAEIDLYQLPAGPLVTRRYTSGAAFTTRPTDSPANTFIDGRLAAGLQVFRRDLFDRATTFGVVAPGRGVITLSNVDGQLDDMLGYAPRAVRLYSGEPGTAFPSAWVQVGVAQVTRITADDKTVQLQLADRLAALQKPLLTAQYAGNNALPMGLEGVDDIKGQRKPRVLGSVLNISPVLVNTSKLIYQVSDQAATVTAVYDGGAALSAGAAYSTLADLQATAPGAGQFRVYSASDGTYVRTGSSAARELTVDAATTETKAGALAAAVASAMGVTVSSGVADITAPVGVYVTDEATALQVIADLLGSIGASAAFDAAGTLRFAQLQAPAAVADVTLRPWQIKAVTMQATEDEDGGLPVWRVQLGYARCWTVQTAGDLAGGSVFRASFTDQEYRQAVATDPARKTAWPDAPEHVAQTALQNKADAEAEAARRLALYAGRQLYEVRLAVTPETAAIDLGQTVRLAWPRWGLAAGKLLRVIGITRNDGNNEITLRLWG